MVSYNPKDWFSYTFKFHKGDTFRRLWLMLVGIGVFSGIIAWLELEIWNLSATNLVKNIPMMHSLLGFAISMILVFRTNTAYDRWWEGRKLWGSLTNNSRNLALKLATILPDPEDSQRSFFRKIIPSFAEALHAHLRRENTRLALADDDEHGHLVQHVDVEKHVPNQIALVIYQHVYDLHKEKIITGEQLLFLNNELMSFTEICGACERIKNTPIPFSYSVFIKKFIFIYIISLPFGYVFSLGYWVIPVVMFIFYVLASLELIAEEIEDPFGGDENDVPTEKIASNIKKNVEEIL
ncbi:MAG: bestrophin family protein [Rhizobacter sp.]|nr:bestrophin family protein [Ferruginibacter sp.]